MALGRSKAIDGGSAAGFRPPNCFFTNASASSGSMSPKTVTIMLLGTKYLA